MLVISCIVSSHTLSRNVRRRTTQSPSAPFTPLASSPYIAISRSSLGTLSSHALPTSPSSALNVGPIACFVQLWNAYNLPHIPSIIRSDDTADLHIFYDIIQCIPSSPQEAHSLHGSLVRRTIPFQFIPLSIYTPGSDLPVLWTCP